MPRFFRWICAGFLFGNMLVATAGRHVLLIGLDGCRSDAFYLMANRFPENTPFYTMWHSSLWNGNFYTGGGLEEGSPQQATLSEPGWTSLLTGVWSDQHHINFNTDLEKNLYNHNISTIFNLVKKHVPGAIVAAFTDWEPTSQLANYVFYGGDAADINRVFPFKKLAELESQDQQMTDEAKTLLESEKPPAFIFVRYGNPDEVGHIFGFDPNGKAYQNAIYFELGEVNRLLQSVELSLKQGEQWLVVITTDHGGHGRVHGSSDWADRRIFAVLHAADDPRYDHASERTDFQGQTELLPIMLNYLSALK